MAMNQAKSSPCSTASCSATRPPIEQPARMGRDRPSARATAMLAKFNDLKLEVRCIGQGAEGRLRVGFVGSATYEVLPTVLESFRVAYPEVNLSLIPMNNAQLHRSPIRREIDIAIARPALDDAEHSDRQSADTRPFPAPFVRWGCAARRGVGPWCRRGRWPPRECRAGPIPSPGWR